MQEHRQLFARQEEERRQLAERSQAEARRRILDAADVDANSLSDQGRRTLDWLADWGTPTIDGVVDLIAAARKAVRVDDHRADLDRQVAALRASEARLDAAMTHHDDRFGPATGGVEL